KRRLPERRRGDARVAGPRDDARPVSLRGEARGDRAGATFGRVMDGQASISADILARYAADAAREVAGVRGLAESPLPGRRGVRVANEDGEVRVELHLPVEWGASV